MKTKSSRIVTSITIVTLLILIGMTGCDLADTSLSIEDQATASSRSLVPTGMETETVNRFTPFTATVALEQVSADTQAVGMSSHFRTNDEVLTGVVTTSDWESLQGARVSMMNFTNFSMEPLANGTFTVSGTNHSTIELFMPSETLTIKANGRIEGNIPFGAAVDMNWSSTGGSDTIAKGSLSGMFVWYTAPPSGTIELKGFYRTR
ncbi:MAG: hypothetical protein K9M84_02265 [Spirochaetia bacterium]|nr:hypothetical protein [Spirochaetia bacterium]